MLPLVLNATNSNQLVIRTYLYQGFDVLSDFGSYWNITRRGTLKEDHPEKTNQKTSRFKRDHLERITYQQIPKAYAKHNKLTIQHYLGLESNRISKRLKSMQCKFHPIVHLKRISAASSNATSSCRPSDQILTFFTVSISESFAAKLKQSFSWKQSRFISGIKSLYNWNYWNPSHEDKFVAKTRDQPEPGR